MILRFGMKAKQRCGKRVGTYYSFAGLSIQAHIYRLASSCESLNAMPRVTKEVQAAADNASAAITPVFRFVCIAPRDAAPRLHLFAFMSRGCAPELVAHGPAGRTHPSHVRWHGQMPALPDFRPRGQAAGNCKSRRCPTMPALTSKLSEVEDVGPERGRILDFQASRSRLI